MIYIFFREITRFVFNISSVFRTKTKREVEINIFLYFVLLIAGYNICLVVFICFFLVEIRVWCHF